MEGDSGTFSGLGNGGGGGGCGGGQIDSKVVQTFQKSFVQVQNILDQNRLLINEINQNHESKMPHNLTRNVGLTRELNNNIRRVVDLYGDLSSSFAKSMDASSEGDSSGAAKSDGKTGLKRNRPA
ncbi:ELF4-like 4 [Hibiscus trionum]|uniref:ELF4-like 4 n=1 Tax=Hibiscus trionum TaxID=183268 RepID=A0A9W7JMN8_HIBTR|nr:ELF4-like 4 [Hibiscus trionum]